jgi:hypothetical protein
VCSSDLDEAVETSEQVIADKNNVYVSCENNGSFFMKAVDKETGKLIWRCSLSNSYSQFGDPLQQTDDYIIQVNAKKIYVIDKKKGKVFARIPIKNSCPRNGDFVIAYQNKVYLAAEKKNGHLIMDMYDVEKKEFQKTLIDFEGKYEALNHRIINNYLYLVTDGHALYKIDLNTDTIINEAEVDTEFESWFYHCTPLCLQDNKLYFTVRTNETEKDDNDQYPEHCIWFCYDLATDTIIEQIDLGSDALGYISGFQGTYGRGAETTPGYIYLNTDKAMNRINIRTKEKETLRMPDYGGDDDIRFFLLFGNGVLLVQEGGAEYRKGCVLHLIG